MKSIKICSWNVNGIRAVLRKGTFLKFIAEYDPDILCLQETKAQQGQAEIDLPQYEEIWNSAERKGYAGTVIFTKVKPQSITHGIPGNTDHLEDHFGHADKEGRVITLDYGDFYLATVYTPNAKRSLERLDYRHKQWDPTFLDYMKELEQKKPVIFCGDLNVAHREIDLARPKDNKKNAGFTKEEREGFDKIVSAGFVDTFRHFNPDQTDAYTWWSHFANSRDRNIGWRIDYFCVSDSLKNQVKNAFILPKVMGSDHCPIGITINIEPNLILTEC